MAPWDRDSKQSEAADLSRQPLTEEDNPFIAFRRFADEQFSTLLAGLNALPGMLSDARSKAAQEQGKWEQELRSESKKWEKDFHNAWDSVWNAGRDAPTPFTQPNEEGRDAARVLLLQARNANTGVDPKKLLELYRDTGDTVIKTHESPFSVWQSDAPWLSVDWFKSSPYSPTQIEQHHHAHQYGSMWRAAFEDLLSAELEKEQSAWEAWTNRVNNQKLYASWAQPGTDWMLGLQCRGILPPQLPQLYQLRSRDTRIQDRIFSDIIQGRPSNIWGSQAVHNDFERLAGEICTFNEDEIATQVCSKDETELDAYEVLLGKLAADSDPVPAQVPDQQPRAAQMAIVQDVKQDMKQDMKQDVKQDVKQDMRQDDREHGGILSTLTTTETTTLPDGSMTTKVVLKKRFANGREESTETVSTTHGRRQEAERPRPSADAHPTAASAGEEQGQQKSNSWFWT